MCFISHKNEKIDIQRPSNNSASFLNFKLGDFVDVAEPLTEGPISPHMKLQVLFNYYQTIYPILKACQASFKNLQLFLVSEVQQTYSSQGVDIDDKHIEVIVKQMTSKVRVSNGGDTTLLPGEILEVNQAELITKAALSVGEGFP